MENTISVLEGKRMDDVVEFVIQPPEGRKWSMGAFYVLLYDQEGYVLTEKIQIPDAVVVM